VGPISRYAKTLVASVPFLIAALKVLSDALGDGTVSNQEWIGTAIALLGAAAVFTVPNKPPAGQPADPNVSEQDPEVHPPTVPAHLDRPDPSEIGAAVHRAAEQARDDTPPENLRG
jgi:hypothetical protein